MPSVTVFHAPTNQRSKLIADAAYKGLKRIGENVVYRSSTDYKGVRSDYAIFYGLACGLDKIFEDYKREATALYVDLGYWRRRINSRFDGYHKITVNSRHPTAYFQNKKHDKSRFKALGIDIKPWIEGGQDIIVAGMSEKAALAEGIAPQSWENSAIRELKQHTKKVITYRPKPSCRRSRPIYGAQFDKSKSLELAFQSCHAVVARQSNTAMDALIGGVPVFCEHGVASVMGLSDLSLIETPHYPDNRKQWAADIAWCQFTPAEIATGMPFIHMKEEGLIPC